MLGGIYKNNFQKVQIYDVEANTWAEGPKMLVGRVDSMAAVVDKKIYVMGGRTAEGNTIKDVDGALEIYDTVSGSWSNGKAMPMPMPVYDATACSYNKKIYVIGGLYNSNSKMDTVQIYDVETNSWFGMM